MPLARNEPKKFVDVSAKNFGGLYREARIKAEALRIVLQPSTPSELTAKCRGSMSLRIQGVLIATDNFSGVV